MLELLDCDSKLSNLFLLGVFNLCFVDEQSLIGLSELVEHVGDESIGQVVGLVDYVLHVLYFDVVFYQLSLPLRLGYGGFGARLH